MAGIYNADGSYNVTGGVGGGGGDASAAKQDEQTTLLTTVDADTSGILTEIEFVRDDILALRTLHEAWDADGTAEVAGFGFDVPVVPVVTIGAYLAGDIIGGLMTFAAVAPGNDLPSILMRVQVTSRIAVSPSLTLHVFNADPSATTKDDNAAYSLAAADVPKLIRSIPFAALGAAWVDHGTPNSISIENLNVPFTPATGTDDIYALLVTADAVTFTGASDIQVRLGGTGH